MHRNTTSPALIALAMTVLLSTTGAAQSPAMTYPLGQYRYQWNTMLNVEGIPLSETKTEFTLTISPGERPNTVNARYDLVKVLNLEDGKKAKNGLKEPKGSATSFMTADGKRQFSFTLDAKNAEADIALPQFREFLPPVPPSSDIGTTWVVPTVYEQRVDDGVSISTERRNVQTTYTVTKDTVVNGIAAVRVDYHGVGTAESVLVARVGDGYNNKYDVNDKSFHVFSKTGVYLGKEVPLDPVNKRPISEISLLQSP